MHDKPVIAIIGPCYPFRGGIATFVRHVCRLLETSFQVHLINYTTLYPSILFPGKTQYDESEQLVFDFPHVRLFSSINPVSWWRTARYLKQLNPDLIIMDWWNPFFGICFRGLYMLLPSRLKSRILIMAENVVSHEGRLPDKLLTRIGLTIASSYIVLSEQVTQQIGPFAGNKKVYKASLPVYDEFRQEEKTVDRAGIHPRLKPEDYVLLCFGYIRHYKGLDIALEAMPQILQAIPQARLLIVGESYDDWSIYQQIIDQLCLQDAVITELSYVPNEAVAGYFHISDLVLLPYRSATQSGILNIAYGFNKPVIANRVGGFAEFVADGKTGLLVDEPSAAALAETVIRFFTSYRNLSVQEHISSLNQQGDFERIADHVADAIACLR